MSADILQDCLGYIDFLRQTGYFVSLSGARASFEPYTSKLLNYEIHLHSICLFLKQNDKSRERCLLNKKTLNNTEITEPYYSCCYAGVEEFVIPVFYNGECIIRINISGYRGNLKKSEKFINRIYQAYGQGAKSLYRELSTNPPELEQLMKFISPLKYMLRELYTHCQGLKNGIDVSSPTKQLYQKALYFIDENYMQEISCDSLAKHFNYSTSYMQYVFKKEGGTTIKAKVNSVRLSKAKHLLTHSHISITDIALACGFTDSNYFSTVFKSKYGHSPRAFRQEL